MGGILVVESLIRELVVMVNAVGACTERRSGVDPGREGQLGFIEIPHGDPAIPDGRFFLWE